jgi:hypothetical protein
MKVFNKSTEVRHWLQDYGFDKESHTVLGQPCQFETCIQSESGLYSIWVGVDFDSLLVQIYVEYDCGGELTRHTADFSDVDVDHEEPFMEALEELVGHYLEIYK